jgi:hypothetical protein
VESWGVGGGDVAGRFWKRISKNEINEADLRPDF